MASTRAPLPCGVDPVFAAPGADGRYSLAAGGLELVVDPKLDGDPVRLALDGEEALVGPFAPGAMAYAAETDGDSLKVLSPNGDRSVRYRLDRGRRSLELSYTLSNPSNAAKEVRALETRSLVPRSGLMFSGETWSASVIDRLVFVEVYVSAWPEKVKLEPGGSNTWSARWLLRHLPAHIAVTPGNPELRAFIEGVIQ